MSKIKQYEVTDGKLVRNPTKEDSIQDSLSSKHVSNATSSNIIGILNLFIFGLLLNSRSILVTMRVIVTVTVLMMMIMIR